MEPWLKEEGVERSPAGEGIQVEGYLEGCL